MSRWRPLVDHPVDTPLRVVTRIVIEVTAWVGGTWVVARSFGPTVAVVALGLMVVVPALFTVRDDKPYVAVPTPGPVRVAIELCLYVVATASVAVLLEGRPLALAAWVAVVLAAAIQSRRWRWLVLHDREPVGRLDGRVGGTDGDGEERHRRAG